MKIIQKKNTIGVLKTLDQFLFLQRPANVFWIPRQIHHPTFLKEYLIIWNISSFGTSSMKIGGTTVENKSKRTLMQEFSGWISKWIHGWIPVSRPSSWRIPWINLKKNKLQKKRYYSKKTERFQKSYMIFSSILIIIYGKV